METKNIKKFDIDFEVKEMGEEDDFFTFEGFASTFNNIDLGGDMVMRGAFSESLKMRNPKLLFQHKMEEPIGIITEVSEDDRGLFIKGKMPKEDSLVKGRVMPQMKVGSINSMSIGYSIEEASYNEEKGCRMLEKVNLFEVSLVTMPMNESAVVTAMKSVYDVETLKDVHEFLKGYGLSNKQRTVVIDRIKAMQEDRPGLDIKTTDAVKQYADNIRSLIDSAKKLK